MTAERNPTDGDSWLGRLMTLLTAITLRFPRVTLGVALGLAIVGTVLSFTRLGYRTSRLDLLNPKSDFNRLWLDYIQEFGDDDDAVIVVEGANRDAVVPVLKELAADLAREDQTFHAVLHEVDLSNVQSKGLHYVGPDDLLKIEQFVTELSPVIEGDWSRLNLGSLTAGMCQRLQAGANQPAQEQAAGQADLQRFSSSVLAALDGEPRYRSPWPEMPASFALLSELQSEYLLANDGRLGFILLRLAKGDGDGFVPRSEATTALRELVRHASDRHPGTNVGVTGLPVMEYDEMLASQSSMFWASIVSMIGVAVLFVAGFGGVRHALLANAVLLIGMAWAFGYATLAVGHLNILSVAFTVTLIGIGIDYGVYYVSRYMQNRESTDSTRDALLDTTRAVGPAIATGAITTSIAFFAAGFTEFTGISELGIIAGGGILLCAIAELFVLPATILLVDEGRLGLRKPTPLPVHRWLSPLFAAPRFWLATCVAVSLVIVAGGRWLRYDNNLLNLQPLGVESVELERKLLAESDQSSWYALSIADSPAELLARKAQFEKLGSVERTEEIVSLLPTEVDKKQPIIERIGKLLAHLPDQPSKIPLTPPAELDRLLNQAQQMFAAADPSGKAAQPFARIRQTIGGLAPADSFARQSRFQQQLAVDMLNRLRLLASMAQPEPPRWSDLPPSLVDRFVGQNGKHLLKIYGRGNIWDTQALDRFASEVRGVDPRATGNPLQAHEASLQMKTSFEQSALYAMIVIVIVLLIDFRNLTHAAIAALPLGVGMLLMFGVMGHFNMPLNPANMIVLPLMLGIGVDYGVHIVHDYRERPGRYRPSPATAVAVLVDGLTTLVGFGALMVATHQGLQSLGRVLTVGVASCMFTSLIMLPLILNWLGHGDQAGTASLDDDSTGDAPSSDNTLDMEHVLVRRRPGSSDSMRRAA
ncbi:MAG: MMPL family transporter [Pirellulales bacterium]